MNNLSIINNSIRNVVRKYIDERHFTNVEFGTAVSIATNNTVYTLDVTDLQGIAHPYRMSVPNEILYNGIEDDVVKMISDIFKNIIETSENMHNKLSKQQVFKK